MSNILLALEITALGMGLVFAAIILLWWMMALLTSVAAEKESGSDSDGEISLTPSTSTGGRGEIVAAIAVAVALAEQQASQARPLSTPPTAIVSAWQLGMRSRQLYQKGMPIVRNPRKVG